MNPRIPQLTLPEGHPLLKPTLHQMGRDGLRAQIVAGVLGSQPSDSPASGPEERPFALIVGGGVAAGKTTIIEALLERGELPPRRYARINADDIKQQIPEYQAICKAGDCRAADIVHEESVLIASQCVGRATEQRRSFILETNLSDPERATTLMHMLRRDGYDIGLLATTIEPETAVQRADDRGRRTGTYVATPALLHSHEKFSRSFAAVSEHADKVCLYENSSHPIRIASKETRHERLTISDPSRFDRFLSVNLRIRTFIAQREREAQQDTLGLAPRHDRTRSLEQTRSGIDRRSPGHPSNPHRGLKI
jgi:predicted ABC-type ATPase